MNKLTKSKLEAAILAAPDSTINDLINAVRKHLDINKILCAGSELDDLKTMYILLKDEQIKRGSIT